MVDLEDTFPEPDMSTEQEKGREELGTNTDTDAAFSENTEDSEGEAAPELLCTAGTPGRHPPAPENHGLVPGMIRHLHHGNSQGRALIFQVRRSKIVLSLLMEKIVGP